MVNVYVQTVLKVINVQRELAQMNFGVINAKIPVNVITITRKCKYFFIFMIIKKYFFNLIFVDAIPGQEIVSVNLAGIVKIVHASVVF